MSINPKKYRIKESFNNKGISLFNLQKKTFWGWKDFAVNHIEESRNFNGSYDKFLGKIIYKFDDIEDCKKFYTNVLAWNDIKYKSRKIMKTWESHDLNNCRYILVMTNPHTFKESLLVKRELDEVIETIDYWDRGKKIKKPIFHKP